MPKKVFTKFEIISVALAQIGKGPINSTSELDDFGNFAVAIYNVQVPALLSVNYWNFANAIVELNMLTQSPPIDRWKYAYQLPAEYLKANALLDDNGYPILEYVIYENKLYTDYTPVKLDHRFYPDESRFSAAFVQYLVYSLAYEYAKPSEVTASVRGELLKTAMAWKSIAIIDSTQTQPNKEIVSRPFIDVRGT
jgi:hypothetical protein